MVNPDNKVRYNPSDENKYVADEDDVRPVSAPQPTNKDFKKVLGRSRKEGKEGETGGEKEESPDEVSDPSLFAGLIAQPSKDDEENASEGSNTPLSLFDLSSKSASKEEPVARPAVKSTAPVHQQPHAPAVESPSDLFKRMALPTRATKTEHAEVIAQNAPVEDAPVQTTPEPKRDKFTTRYTPEQTDLSYVNPLAANVTVPINTNIVSETKAVERPAPVSQSMQELINHVVKTMYTIENKGSTDIIITLQYPPLFKDANLVVTAYDSARGQFNISFENLTQAAKQVLDIADNRQALMLALEQKGYALQIVQTTTLIEHPVPTDQSDSTRGGRQQQEREDRDEQQRRRK